MFPPLQGTLPPELSATPADPGVLIDQQTAEKVASVLVPLRMDSLLRHDLAAIRQLEADDALLVDLAGGSYDPPAPNAVRYGMVDGLEQTQYPVSFVDEVQWTAADGHNVIDLIVITRADAASTWKVSLEAPFRGTAAQGCSPPTVMSRSTPRSNR